jgi:hypothetical protein
LDLGLTVTDEALLVLVRHRSRQYRVRLAAELVVDHVRRRRAQEALYVVAAVACVVLARREADQPAGAYVRMQSLLAQAADLAAHSAAAAAAAHYAGRATDGRAMIGRAVNRLERLEGGEHEDLMKGDERRSAETSGGEQR